MTSHQEEDFVTYKRFDRPEIAKLLTDLLDENSIPYLVVGDELSVPDIIVGDVGKTIEIRIHQEDFEKVDKIVEDRANVELDQVDKDYFIFQFSNDELKEVLVKAQEWSPLDVALANKLLKERGVDFSREELDSLREKEVLESAQPRDMDKSTLILLYVCLLILPLVPAIGGPWVLIARKIDLLGNRVNTFTESSRRHGKILTVVGWLLVVVWVVLRLNYE
jgi:hypothetical protein